MKTVIESTITWRGSVTDLATDCAWLLTPEEGQRLIDELRRFLRERPIKFAGRGRPRSG